MEKGRLVVRHQYGPLSLDPTAPESSNEQWNRANSPRLRTESSCTQLRFLQWWWPLHQDRRHGPLQRCGRSFVDVFHRPARRPSSPLASQSHASTRFIESTLQRAIRLRGFCFFLASGGVHVSRHTRFSPAVRMCGRLFLAHWPEARRGTAPRQPIVPPIDGCIRPVM